MSKESVKATKEHILEVARREFFSKGYEGASINTIVAAARITKPTVYYHFKNKENLFRALLHESYDHCLQNRRSALNEKLPFSEQVASVISADFRFCLASPELVRFVLAQTFALPGESEFDLTEVHYRDYRFFFDLIESGNLSGEINCRDVMSAALSLQGIIDINIVSFLKMDHEADFLSDKRAYSIAETFLNGISAGA